MMITQIAPALISASVMKRLITAVLLLAFQVSSHSRASAQTQVSWEQLEQQILAEHNRVRKNPKSYVPLLEAWLEQTDEQGMVRLNQTTQLQTVEGRQAIQAAIAFLNTQSRRPALSASQGLKNVAKSHSAYLQTGSTGHRGRRGQSPESRFLEFGRPIGLFGENISYGLQTPETILMGLIINDGNPRRGHRRNLFESRFRRVGVGCGQHQTFWVVCVMTYANDFRE
ncbi:MAG: CAP domain-containing protein [Cyanobacteria bacterium P01_F01_bin.42]